MQRQIFYLAAILVLLALAGCITVKDRTSCPVPIEDSDVAEPATDEDLISGFAVKDVVEDVVEEQPSQKQVVKEATPELTESDSGLPQKVVTEGDLVSFPNLLATDPDGDPLSYTFTAPLDGDGTWQTEVGDAGSYKVQITASDGTTSATQELVIVVKSANALPEIAFIENIVVEEGDTFDINPSVTDADGDEVTVTLRGWKTELPYTTNFNDAGSHLIVVEATDGKETVTQDVKVTVKNVNRAPVVDSFDDVVITEKDKVTVKPTAKDLDGDEVRFIYSDPLNEEGTWQTQIGDAGKYEIKIAASDGELSSTVEFFIIVESLNKPPVLNGVTDIVVQEGETVVTNIVAEDPEGQAVDVVFSGWMTSATKETAFNDAGSYEVTVTASDGETQTVETFVVTVTDVNRPPVFNTDAFA